ncbi:MAG TPA: molybdenum cofactor guanylyltransferase MobA [Trinickia sp.]|uniref:molybdenum cofactor guanylyltransferase MobA n=1 Tax=Trinickia sp. TaxID=2571163 RepID=UPI002C40441D|nr:molybdenum cofactor guanylyltransferase MobA [Trinickia sp.]HVW49473.1 molybdenum cofactor guanylyltransferase MobA [Trinickia sp.]
MNSDLRSRLTGLVLAGGQGTRMGGIDKGLQLLGGEPLALHAAKCIAEQVGPLLFSANRNIDRYRLLAERFGARVVQDASSDFAGPLAGMLAGLRETTTELLLCVPCDTPRLPRDLAARLVAALDDARADVAAAATVDAQGKASVHPVVAVIRATLADDLAAFLDAGERKVRAWYARHKHVEVAFEDEHAFYNANFLHELADLARTFGD